MCTNIAGDCEIKTHTPSEGKCSYQGDFDYPIFITKEMGCMTLEADGDYNGLCYHVPNEGKNLFNS